MLALVGEFKHIRLLFTSEERWKDFCICICSGYLPDFSLGRAQGKPGTFWRDYVSRLLLERLGVPLEELVRERSLWISLLRLLTLQPGPIEAALNEMKPNFDDGNSDTWGQVTVITGNSPSK